jgi:2',3'-cyclic-nucleotide 2'-phosphodiesterase
LKILFIGDIAGKVGRRMLAERLPGLLQRHETDLCIVNGENSAGGFGITNENAEDIFGAGADVITSGNHIWNKKETKEFMLHEPRLLRPSNYPTGAPGLGFFIANTLQGPVAVINLMGRVFMPPVDCPFQEANRLLKNLDSNVRMIFVDFHAEATSEKVAMGWHLDGRVSAVIGTHTHIQTADERVLPQGTAFLSDAGMTGPADSVIGIKTSIAVGKFLSGIPNRFEVSGGRGQINGVLVEVNPESGRANSILRISEQEDSG